MCSSLSLKIRNLSPELINKFETLLVRAVLLGMLLLITFQCVMLNESARVFLNYATTLEGGALEESAILTREGSLYLVLENEGPIPEAKLLLNGEPVTALDTDEVKIMVRNNDVLELDTSRSDDEFVHICVVGISDNVLQPSVGLRVKARNKIELISRVKLK